MTAPARARWRRWLWGVVGIALVWYGGIRWQTVEYDHRIRQIQEALERLRPDVLQVLEAKELQATLRAQQQFAETVKARVVDWDVVFRQIADALPASVVLSAMAIDGPSLTLQGVLRHVPPEPQAYLAGVASTLKQRGVAQDLVVTVTPPGTEDPTTAQVELRGRLP